MCTLVIIVGKCYDKTIRWGHDLVWWLRQHFLEEMIFNLNSKQNKTKRIEANLGEGRVTRMLQTMRVNFLPRA